MRRRAPGQYSSIAGSHGECAVHPCGRCTVRRVGRDGREVRSPGHKIVVVTQIGFGWTWLPNERMRH
jgi:hypothetical protein